MARGDQINRLVTSPIGIVGNENRNAMAIFIQGTVHGMLNNIQASNRLRSQYRSKHGAIVVFLDKRFASSPQGLDDHLENRIQALLSRGILDESSVGLYKNITSNQKVYEWAMDRSTCRVVSAESLFGMENSTPCGVCDNCLSSPVALARSQQIAQKDQSQQLKIKAHHVLRILEYEKCLVCGSPKCNGESCLPYGACFCCGITGHRRNQCPLRWVTVLRSTPASCSSCLDNKACDGFAFGHNPRECRYQRRLKRIVLQGALQSNGMPSPQHLQQATSFISQYAAGVLSSSECLYGLLTQYHQPATASTTSTQDFFCASHYE